MSKTRKHDYDGSKVKTLSSLEHIRKRTGMYIGRIGDGLPMTETRAFTPKPLPAAAGNDGPAGAPDCQTVVSKRPLSVSNPWTPETSVSWPKCVSISPVSKPDGKQEKPIRLPPTTRSWDGNVGLTTCKGGIAGDTCEFIAELDFTAPSTPGEIRLDLELITDDFVIANTYRTSVG